MKRIIIIGIFCFILLLVGCDCNDIGKAKCFDDCLPHNLNATSTCNDVCKEKSICIGNIYITRYN